MTFSSHALRLVVRFLGFSHLLIALGAGACVYITFNVAGIEGGNECENFPVICFITACTGLGYSVQRFIKTRVFPSCVPKDRLDFLGKYGVALVLLWSVAWGWSFVNVFEIFTSSVLWILIALGGAGLSYAILPRFFHGLARSVRELPGAKLPVLSLVWGGATVVLPLMIVGADLDYELIWWIFIARVLYIAGLTIPFDVRDLNVDDDNMRTLPMMMGVVRSLWLACGLMVVSGCVYAYLNMYNLTAHALLTAVLVCPRVYKSYWGEWYYSLLLDGMLVLLFIV